MRFKKKQRDPWHGSRTQFQGRQCRVGAEILLVVDGSCINNGRHADKTRVPSAGCAFVFNTRDLDTGDTPHSFFFDDAAEPGVVAFPLEKRGPSGDLLEHTSNRAKLRAVIAALQFRPWAGEGWKRVVILTDLKYVVLGATQWLPRWVKRRWRKPYRKGQRPPRDRCYVNRDLWEELQYTIEQLRGQGCEVSFWLDPRGRAVEHDCTGEAGGGKGSEGNVWR
ncbi:hypothetical protein VTJ49DRAFT_413 [Mycothermus thermophilus]|uniref:RNase H type-1 domain-containing protein n=1 Tax=Humicola insolens TaxID=85995 RepID=A0ABR3VFA8_HUMIN